MTNLNSLNPEFTKMLSEPICVEIDSREKYPVPFPSSVLIHDPNNSDRQLRLPVITRKKTLASGDYRLEAFPDVCVIERKASPSELYQNLFDPKDVIRQGKAFWRLSQACKYPYLFIESTPSQILKTASCKFQLPLNFDPDLILHRLSVAASKYNFNLLWLPQTTTRTTRINTGRVLLHTMLGHALYTVSEGEPVVPGVGSAGPSVLDPTEPALISN